MAGKDTITKEYMQDNAIFADAFNFFMYNGRQVISPQNLRELDTSAIVLPYGDDNKINPVQKERDVFKMIVAMEDDNAAYLLLGIENQSSIHYAMPVRNMLYDSIQYANQVTSAAKSHKAAHNTGDSKEEYLSGFYKTDRLLPVITLVIYFGAEEWDAPKSIHEMLSVQDDEILKYTADYRINLISPNEIDDNDFSKFHTELNVVLKYIKYSKDKKKLNEILNNDTAFRSVPRKAADVINAVTNSNMKFKDREENVDMCEAIKGMINDAIKDVEDRAKNAEKRCKALEDMKKDAEKKYNTFAINLLKLNKLTYEEIAEAAGLSVEEIKKIAAELH